MSSSRSASSSVVAAILLLVLLAIAGSASACRRQAELDPNAAARRLQLIEEWERQVSGHGGPALNAAALLGGCLRDFEAPREQRLRCARALGAAAGLPAAAAHELGEAALADLNLQRDRRDPYVAAEAARNLGKLAQRRSFPVLLRLLRSNYPAMVRRAAQKAINQIDWSEARSHPQNQ